MRFVPVKTPSIIKRCYPNYVWDVKTTEKIVYLTFDDGPTPEITEFVLDQLQNYNAKASFFCIGSNVEKYPEIFSRILLEDHAIGNHTMNHVRGWQTKNEDYLVEAEKALSAFEAALPSDEKFVNSFKTFKSADLGSNSISVLNQNLGRQVTSNLFRPPYGQIKRKQANKLINLGYEIIMWDVLSFDWSTSISKEECLLNVNSRAKSGSIVVFHDSKKASNNMMYALPKVLKYFTDLGYRFEKITT